jgi:UDP-2-acetamido-2-deoxy-ribo-hexuluronate aminotransferase
MQFIDLQAQRLRIEKEINAAVAAVIEHGRYIMGPEVGRLESELAAFVGSSHCVGCSSGTDALLMALMAFEVGPGDAVLTTPFTFFATAEVISLLGATPVFVDVDPRTYNISPEALAVVANKVKTEGKLRLRGVVTVDLFGLPCDYERIMPIAEKHDMFIVQDAAQACGAIYRGKRVPTQGHIGTTSFFPAKPLGCYGDGGAVFTDDPVLAEKLRSIRVHGKGNDKYNNVRIGLNARLDTLQAAIVLEKLKIYPDEIERRQRVASAYSAGLSDVAGLTPPVVPDGSQSVWAQFTVRAADSTARSAAQAALKEKGIPTAIYYIKPLHLLEAFRHLGYREGDFPVSETASTQVFSLPFHPYLKNEEIETICGVIQKGKVRASKVGFSSAPYDLPPKTP